MLKKQLKLVCLESMADIATGELIEDITLRQTDLLLRDIVEEAVEDINTEN